VTTLGSTYPIGGGEIARGIPAPPWHFGSDVIQVDFQVAPATLAAFLPPGIEASAIEPGRVQIAFCSVAAVGDAADQSVVAPGDANFEECLVKLRARAGDLEGWYVSHSWVTNDVSLQRGIVQGFPKRIGRVALTRFDTVQARAGGRWKGARLGGVLEAPDGLRLSVVHECAERPAPTDAPLPFLLCRRFPSLFAPLDRSVDEIVSPIIENAVEVDVWSGPAHVAASGAADAMPLFEPLDRPWSRSLRTAFTITGARLVNRNG
jgi:hypothetical protein